METFGIVMLVLMALSFGMPFFGVLAWSGFLFALSLLDWLESAWCRITQSERW